MHHEAAQQLAIPTMERCARAKAEAGTFQSKQLSRGTILMKTKKEPWPRSGYDAPAAIAAALLVVVVLTAFFAAGWLS